MRAIALGLLVGLGTGCDLVVVDDYPVSQGYTDRDADGVSDRTERAYGTDPNRVDTDRDGAWDGEEIFDLGTDPLDPDTDGDGWFDGEEAYYWFTDPLVPNF